MKERILVQYSVLKNTDNTKKLFSLEEKFNKNFNNDSYNEWKNLYEKCLKEKSVKTIKGLEESLKKYEAMFANGYKAEALEESEYDFHDPVLDTKKQGTTAYEVKDGVVSELASFGIDEKHGYHFEYKVNNDTSEDRNWDVELIAKDGFDLKTYNKIRKIFNAYSNIKSYDGKRNGNKITSIYLDFDVTERNESLTECNKELNEYRIASSNTDERVKRIITKFNHIQDKLDYYSDKGVKGYNSSLRSYMSRWLDNRVEDYDISRDDRKAIMNATYVGTFDALKQLSDLQLTCLEKIIKDRTDALKRMAKDYKDLKAENKIKPIKDKLMSMKKEIEDKNKQMYWAQHYGDDESGDWDTSDRLEDEINKIKDEMRKIVTKYPELEYMLEESLTEASYGGAYDIEDDMFWTKDDLIEFSDAVCDKLTEKFGYQYDIADVGAESNNDMYILIEDTTHGIEADVSFRIKMSRIRAPRDLMKYLDTVVAEFVKKFEEEYQYYEFDESLNEDMSAVMDDFAYARRNWDRIGTGISLDDALEEYNAQYGQEGFYARPLYSESEWNKMVNMFADVETITEAVDDEEIDLDVETDFSDGEVEEGDTFIEDGREWSWIERIAGPIHLDFDNWAVWSARDWDYIQEKIRPILLNKEELTVETLTKIYDEAEVAYFVVDEDTGFIDWGPVESQTEAQDFLNGKVEDWENDEYDESLQEGKILDGVKSSANKMLSKHYTKKAMNALGKGNIQKFKKNIDKAITKQEKTKEWGKIQDNIKDASNEFNNSKEKAQNRLKQLNDKSKDESLKESKDLKEWWTVDLDYEDIGSYGYTYEVDGEEVVDYLTEMLYENGEYPDFLEDKSDEEINAWLDDKENYPKFRDWVEENIDDLLKKYEYDVLEYFEDDAIIKYDDEHEDDDWGYGSDNGSGMTDRDFL